MTTDQPKRILVLGAGAVGGYVGGCLAAAGHSVILLCTPATAAAVRADGLRVERPDGELQVRPEAVDDPAAAFSGGSVDLAIVAVKRYDTDTAIGPLAGFAGRMEHVLCLQNGIGAEDRLAELLGKSGIIPGTVTTAVARKGRNRVVVERKRGIGIAGNGEWTGIFDSAGLKARYYPDAADMKWSKLITNLIANATSAILDLPPARIFADGDLFRLEMLALRETLSVMKAIGANVVDLPGLPVQALAFCAARLPLPLSRLILGPALGRGRGEKMPSFHADLYGGDGRSEIGYYHGAVIRAAETCGIDVPVIRLLTETFTGILDGRITRETYRNHPEQLISRLP